METIVRSRTESSVRHYLNTEPINLTTRQPSSTNNLTLVEMKEKLLNMMTKQSQCLQEELDLNGIHHWHEMRILFYKSKLACGSEHEVYHESTIVAIHDADVESKYGYNLMSMMKVKRVDSKTYKFKESYYNELSLNYIEDIYMLKVQGKLHHLPGNIEYGLRSLVIRKRVEDVSSVWKAIS
ncbi:hypothetical protein Tco_1416211 [Tanacetum coccineum]